MLKDKIIQIRMDSYALGDNIAWIPYVEQFRIIHNCTVICSTFFNELFSPVYPDIIFANPNNPILNTYKTYYIGVSQLGKEPDRGLSRWRDIPLQKVVCDVLDIPYNPLIPKVSYNDIEIPFKNYACISEFSSCKMKEWNYLNGFQIIVDYLISKNVIPVVCSKEPTNLKNIINLTGDRPLKNRAKLLKDAKFFIGVSSGLSWLSYAVQTPVIMISGCTKPFHEFSCERVTNTIGCNGCINDYTFEYSKVCQHVNEFECSKNISPDMVIEKIEKLI